jgi:glycosyltransferase involved in cell wall biosynthesis
MKVSIVIPAFNEEKLIAETLTRIRAAMTAFTALGWQSELVVCDNNSTDHTADIAASAGAKVVFEPINQISRARNTGATAAEGDWFIFIDADSHPDQALFAAVAGEIQSGDCLAGGSTLKLAGRHPVASLITASWNRISRMMKWAPGSFIFCEAAAFRKIGGFSEQLYASEEIDLFMRLKRLAAAKKKRIAILHDHPLTTSARKLHLYTPWEHARFMGKTILQFGRPLRKRESCPTWYDGRR